MPPATRSRRSTAPGQPAEPRIVCIGHSHSEPVAASAAAQQAPVEVLNFWHVKDAITVVAGLPRLSEAVRARLVAPVFSLVGGAVHQDIGLVVHKRPFDFVLPWRPDLPLEPGAEIIPYAAIRAAMAARTAYFLAIMSEVRAATAGAVFHMESPPTYAGETLPDNDPAFAHFFGADARFSPPWLRYKLWRLHSALVAEHCMAAGIELIPHPPEATDAQGFLLPGYHGTPAHANAAYGALLLDQMRAAARRTMPPPDSRTAPVRRRLWSALPGFAARG